MPVASTSTATPSTSVPLRKRSRTDMTPEERREARAERNRIAAQCSRDRRKAQFAALEARVAELEQENKALRMGLLVPQSQNTTSLVHLTPRDIERERENEELRERVRMLERSWELVSKALTPQQGFAPIIPPTLPSQTTGSRHSPAPSFAISSPPSSLPSPTPATPPSIRAIPDHSSARHLAAGGSSGLDFGPSTGVILSSSSRRSSTEWYPTAAPASVTRPGSRDSIASNFAIPTSMSSTSSWSAPTAEDASLLASLLSRDVSSAPTLTKPSPELWSSFQVWNDGAPAVF